MENSTINNLIIQAIFNFKFVVILNVFLISASATLGILVAKKSAETFISYIQYKWTLKYEIKAIEIKELNNKMHDRLVEIGEALESNTKPNNYVKIKTRLRYNSSRLGKYDKTIPISVNDLLSVLTSDITTNEVVANEEKAARAKVLIEQIRGKVDNLWL